ncbi:Retinol dehydrogenase 5 [Mactra antiquata]
MKLELTIDLQYVVTAIVIFLTVRWLLWKLKVGNYNTRYVFITGCDTGFGKLLAQRLDKLGCHVIAGCMTSSQCTELKKVCSNRLETVVMNVCDVKSIETARKHVEKFLPGDKSLWAIVNNAGISGNIAPTEWTSNESFKSVIEVNLLGVMYVAKEFLPLVRREKGRVINMASIMGRFAISTAGYSASKFGVEGFSDQLRRELYRAGVSVHLIEPGYFRTGIVEENHLALSMSKSFKESTPEVQKFYGKSYLQTTTERSTKALTLIMSSDLNKVINAYEHSITAKYPKTRYVVGWDSQILFRLLWNLPECISDFIVSRGMAVPEGAQ